MHQKAQCLTGKRQKKSWQSLLKASVWEYLCMEKIGIIDVWVTCIVMESSFKWVQWYLWMSRPNLHTPRLILQVVWLYCGFMYLAIYEQVFGSLYRKSCWKRGLHGITLPMTNAQSWQRWVTFPFHFKLLLIKTSI